MEGRSKPPEFTIELSADRQNVKDVVKGIYNHHWSLIAALTDNELGIMRTIFFHRTFTPITPSTHDVLDVTLPYIPDNADLESLLETRTIALLRHLDNPTTTTLSPQYNPKSTTSNSSNSSSRGTLTIQFLERKRRKGWFIAKADEETVWESWVIEVNLSTARSEPEAERNRRVMEESLQGAAMKVVQVVNREKEHIPPITTNEANPFPYQILVNSKG
jgi:autophagy-related protein 101